MSCLSQETSSPVAELTWGTNPAALMKLGYYKETHCTYYNVRKFLSKLILEREIIWSPSNKQKKQIPETTNEISYSKSVSQSWVF